MAETFIYLPHMKRTMTKFYTREELKQQQETGEIAFFESDSPLLAERWNKCARLMAQLTPDFFMAYNNFLYDEPPEYEKWHEDGIPEKSYADRYSGPVFGCDWDYMVGPHDWYRTDEDPKLNDFVLRKKIYIYDWSYRQYEAAREHAYAPRNPELEYFFKLHAEFKEVLQYYYTVCFADQAPNIEKLLYKMMVIEYSHPTADDTNITEHRKFSTERFGDSHCDETLCGIHLGENITEFVYENTLTGEWTPANITDNKLLMFFSEDSEKSGWMPLYHGMRHNPETNLKTRYAIIFDLQARYKEEN